MIGTTCKMIKGKNVTQVYAIKKITQYVRHNSLAQKHISVFETVTNQLI